jgi:cytochrome c-type biogenesis protein CcmE
MRVGGMVVDGSLKRSTDSLRVSFELTDYENTVKVVFTGILPDLFREGQGIIAQGKMDAQGVFQADEVLAKHDENYMPPEIAESMKAKKEVTQ